jgi:hypothetical protein
MTPFSICNCEVTIIHQTIPEKHIPALLRDGHYFTPCHDFRDWTEFYYGYSLFNYHMVSENDIERAVQHAIRDHALRAFAESARVSCWTVDLQDELRMWREYGSGGAAIRISVDADRFCQHLADRHIVHNQVTYEGQISMVHTNRYFLVRHNLTSDEDKNHHFFFHKRGKFDWEHEFRIVIFSRERPTTVALDDDMIMQIVSSPLARLQPEIERVLRARFGRRFIPSAKNGSLVAG